MLVKSSENMEDVLDVSTENLKQMEEEAAMVREDTLMRYIRVMSELSNQIRYSSSKRVLVEMAFIKLCKPQMEHDEISLTERVRLLEKKLEEYAAIIQSGIIPAGGLPAGGTAGTLGGPGVYGGAAGSPGGPGIYGGAAGSPDSPGGYSGAADARYEEVYGQLPGAAQDPAGSPLGELPKAAPKDLQQVKAMWKSIIAQTHGRFRVVLSSSEIKYNTSAVSYTHLTLPTIA